VKGLPPVRTEYRVPSTEHRQFLPVLGPRAAHHPPRQQLPDDRRAHHVAGSRRFARLIREGKYAEAADVALEQVRGGANMIDVNMDEGLLESSRR